jgi:hypothetical protein
MDSKETRFESMHYTHQAKDGVNSSEHGIEYPGCTKGRELSH